MAHEFRSKVLKSLVAKRLEVYDFCASLSSSKALADVNVGY
jgi:hypothetical protein